MSTPPRSAPNVTRTGTFDPTKNYKNARIQQGVPLFDVDVNDGLDAAAHQSKTATLAGRGESGAVRSGNTFRLTAIDPTTPRSIGNLRNFALVPGRVDTRFGAIDTDSMFDTADTDELRRILPFDSHRLAGSGFATSDLLLWKNRLFEGRATSATAWSDTEPMVLTDANKAFSPEHRLLGTLNDVTIPNTRMDLGGLPAEPFAFANKCEIREQAAEVRFLSGANAGISVPIVAVSATSVTVTGGFLTNPIEVGDEYVICPANMLREYEDAFEARGVDASPVAFDVIGATTRLPWFVVYLHAFEDSISTDEDDDLEHPALTGTDVACRTRVGWAVRTALVEFNGVPTSDALAGVLDSIGAVKYGANNLTQQDLLALGAVTEQGLRSEDMRGLAVLNDSRGTGRLLYEGVASHVERLLNTNMQTVELREARTDSRVLCVLAPKTKQEATTVMTPFFYPGYSDETNDGETGFGTAGLMLPGGWFWEPARAPADSAALLGELSAARALLRLKAYDGRTGYAHTAAGTSEAVPLFRSVDEHIAFLDHLILNVTGLGWSQGIGSSLIRDSDGVVTAAGQPASTFAVETGFEAHDVNLSESFVGTVHMLDPLAGGKGVWSATTYHLLDGTPVEEGDFEGWTPIQDESEGWGDYGARSPVGLEAAQALRGALNFRKLAVKTVAHREADLFNYALQFDKTSAGPHASLDATTYRTDDELVLKDVVVGNTSMASPFRFADGYGITNAQAYNIGSLYMLPESFEEGAAANGVWGAGKYVVGNVYAAYGTRLSGQVANEAFALPEFYPEPWFVEDDGVRRGKASSVAHESSRTGSLADAWGRADSFTVAYDRPLSTILNRCTVMRLRYHIGDFYPAPNGENALVDNLHLFVRIEPLSAVHWATMPKHQHSVLADSMSIYSSLERMLEFFNDQALTDPYSEQRTARFVNGGAIEQATDTDADYIAVDTPGTAVAQANLFPIVHTAWPEMAVPEGTADWASRNAKTGRVGAMPDTDADTAFVGALGTSVNLGSGEESLRAFVDPALLGGRWNVNTGRQVPLNAAPSASAYLEYNDGFQKAALEAMAIHGSGLAPASVLPLMGLMSATYNMGLQQKLLWNCSFRVLHARPGGGYQASAFTPTATAPPEPRSLTELFVVRNRQTGEAVELPSEPTSADKKVYLHLGSMHPSAAATTAKMRDGAPVATVAHPNHALLGHLYPMVQDSIGGSFSASSDRLNKANLSDTDDVRVRTTDFVSTSLPDSLTGDTYSADPFDAMFERAFSSDVAGEYQTALTDRLSQNSGIEIDLLNELRYVRENPTPHGLDKEASLGFGTLSWLDMMPTAKDLTAPGDHEILFVLYTGSYGQKMVDDAVSARVNPSYCGCHLVASVEVNRPSQKRSSDGALHYGRAAETFHVLGHL